MTQETTLTNGPAAAAILAAGIGSLALGLFTTLAQAIGPVKNILNFYSLAGPLSGKTTMTVVIWAVAWVALHGQWKGKHLPFAKVFVVTLIMIALGLLGTFPLFFELFGG